MAKYKNRRREGFLGASKTVIIVTFVVMIALYCVVKEMGALLPPGMQGLVRAVRSANPFTLILTGSVVASVVYGAITLIYLTGKWISGNTRGVRRTDHPTALLFFALNLPFMALIAAYPGYALVCFIIEKINFTLIPQSYSVWSALFFAVVMGVVDYRVSANKRNWVALLISHAVVAIAASFWLYAFAFILLCVILSPVFRLGKIYLGTYDRIYDCVPDILSTQRRMEITNEIMHSSLGVMAMFHLWDNREV